MAQKICCGGFELGDGLELDGRTLKATGGGSGDGDMTKAVYDSDGSIAESGGIAAYFEEHGGGGETSNVVFINLTSEDEEDDITYSCDKSVVEIMNIIENHPETSVIAILDGQSYYQLSNCDYGISFSKAVYREYDTVGGYAYLVAGTDIFNGYVDDETGFDKWVRRLGRAFPLITSPTEQGTYNLKCVVNEDGELYFSWVEELNS